MILRTVYVRFYRAFNFDYLRKRHPMSVPDPWDEMADGMFYPYVRLEVDREFTAVVGANESGKSQLLQAIECALGKARPTPADFCRYSTYFTVSEDMRTPHCGLYFEDVTPEEADSLSGIVPVNDIGRLSSFHLFRTDPERITFYFENQKHDVNDLGPFAQSLPRVFRIDPGRAIPNSVPISFLVTRASTANVDPGPTRTDRWSLVSPVVEHASELLPVLQNPQELAARVQSIFADAHALSGLSDREAESYRNQLDLAFDLLITVGGINVSSFAELQKALRNDDEGMANGIVAAMNEQLATSLNLAKWWSQDPHFRLAITVRDFDIVFTIRDRTGSEYSFAERSSGLKYFLSYLVQFLAHVRERRGHEILLMDEPDAYLSNQGQQDLLRLLHEFTLPTECCPGGQVLYVTHSPFLIDKNRADRIRVLDKGSGDEGARVVRDVGRNHFEPLRTALGSFVGETAFIGNCNLMLEGIADQVYLAGMSDLLSQAGAASTERLDLNHVTLVPVGSVSHLPYMTYLARGRDADKPAVIVLVDGDDEGDRAVKDLLRGGPRNKQLIQREYIAQLKPNGIPKLTSDRPGGPLDLEDLIPVEIGIRAAGAFLREMSDEAMNQLPSTEAVSRLLSESTGVFAAVQQGFSDSGSQLRLEKIGFARHVLTEFRNELQNETAPGKRMQERFGALFSHLTAMQRKASRERERESIAARVDREKSLFVRDRLARATKADIIILLERIESLIDQSIEGDALMIGIRRIRDDFDLDRDLNASIDDPDSLADRIDALKYAEVLASQPEAQYAIVSANGGRDRPMKSTVSPDDSTVELGLGESAS